MWYNENITSFGGFYEKFSVNNKRKNHRGSGYACANRGRNCADYFAQHMHNCDLINLEDMLQNGTVISGTLIERPHSFSTACNITTQIVAQVASSQYGGQSFSLTHLAPFVDVSRKRIHKDVVEEVNEGIEAGNLPIKVNSEEYNKYISHVVEKRVKDEIKRGVQMIQYQVITLMTTNGF